KVIWKLLFLNVISSRFVKTPFLARGYPHVVGKEKGEEITHSKTTIQKKLVTRIPTAQYGGRHACTMLLGSGIGTELMTYARDIFQYAGCLIDFEVINIDPSSSGNDD
uniref:Uncharacterized protein n=1 Tax=Megaselia scalaris TaxID=36166 RepID=T1H2N5_MEGSC